MLGSKQLLSLLALASLSVRAQDVNVNNYTIVNGQIYTPGLAIVDAPQPNTPEGGDYLQVALDVSYDGAIPLPPYPSGSENEIYNITIFLYSYDIGRNFTISNGTATANNASLGPVMEMEPSSTVKHVNWIWPDCLVGNGPAAENNASNERGTYNISIHQSFRLNGSDYYTIFDLPIEVTNEIPESSDRASCDALDNNLIDASQLDAVGPSATLPYAVATQTSSSSGSSSTDGLGGSEPDSTGGGLGAASNMKPHYGLFALVIFVFSAMVVL